jgi:hypothetical protein
LHPGNAVLHPACDPILKELLDFLSDDCMNFDPPDGLIQTSALIVHQPESWNESFRFQLSNFSLSYTFGAALYGSPDETNIVIQTRLCQIFSIL